MKLDIKTFIIVVVVFFIYCILLSTWIKYALILATIMLVLGYASSIVIAAFLGVIIKNKFGEISAGLYCAASIAMLFSTILGGPINFYYETIGGEIGLFIGSMMTMIYPPEFYKHNTDYYKNGRDDEYPKT